MTAIRQSIEVGAPVHAVYQYLTHFEDYPRFMQDIDAVQQVDATHLHWSAHMSYQPLEWDTEITEQTPDRCIAWRNTSGPTHAGRVELQPAGPASARMTLTLEADAGPLPASDAEVALAQQLHQDLASFKQFIETHDASMLQASPSAAMPQAQQSTQSEAAMSQPVNEPSVAEEQSFDQQSEQARRVGQMPEQLSEALGALQQEESEGKDEAQLKKAVERAVPPSE